MVRKERWLGKKLMRKFFCFILILSLFFGCSISFAKEDIAHQIWKEMADAGGIDFDECWELAGMYSLGKTTASGYVTLPMTEDGTQLTSPVSWRIHPQSEMDITNKFFPMLEVLINAMEPESQQEEIAEWMLTQKAIALLAKYNILPYKSDTVQFGKLEIYVKYDEVHNELYCLINR